jgi:hypothetical protein
MWPGVGLVAFGILDYYMLITDLYEREVLTYTVIGGLLVATGVTFKILANSRVKKAVSMYNSYEVAPTLGDNYFPELSFGVTRGGLGLTMTF